MILRLTKPIFTGQSLASYSLVQDWLNDAGLGLCPSVTDYYYWTLTSEIGSIFYYCLLFPNKKIWLNIKNIKLAASLMSLIIV